MRGVSLFLVSWFGPNWGNAMGGQGPEGQSSGCSLTEPAKAWLAARGKLISAPLILSGLELVHSMLWKVWGLGKQPPWLTARLCEKWLMLSGNSAIHFPVFFSLRWVWRFYSTAAQEQQTLLLCQLPCFQRGPILKPSTLWCLGEIALLGSWGEPHGSSPSTSLLMTHQVTKVLSPIGHRAAGDCSQSASLPWILGKNNTYTARLAMHTLN